MRAMIMTKTGRRILLSDKQAAAFEKIGIAHEDTTRVVKKPFVPMSAPIVVKPEPDPELEQKRIRRYKRRDLEAEETKCENYPESTQF